MNSSIVGETRWIYTIKNQSSGIKKIHFDFKRYNTFQPTLPVKCCIKYAMLQYHILYLLLTINAYHLYLYLFSNLNQLPGYQISLCIPQSFLTIKKGFFQASKKC